MKALILAGGNGTRLRPVTYEIPKPLVTVKKKPIVNHLIELFRRHGIEDVGLLIARNHESDFQRWQKAWADELEGSNVNLFYEETPRGTFGGVVELKDWLGEQFLMTNGDELKDFDLTSLINFHNEHGKTGTIALVQVPNPHEYGVPVMDGHAIREFLEKPANPPSSFINSGLYILNSNIFDHSIPGQHYQMIEKDIFPKLASLGQLSGFNLANSRWYDCGNLERWERAIHEW